MNPPDHPKAPPQRKRSTDRDLLYLVATAFALLLMISPAMKGAALATVVLVAGVFIALLVIGLVTVQYGAGFACIIAGILLAVFFAVIFPTTVKTEIGAVNNIGLMNDRLIGVIGGIGLAMLGAVLSLRRK